MKVYNFYPGEKIFDIAFIIFVLVGTISIIPRFITSLFQSPGLWHVFYIIVAATTSTYFIRSFRYWLSSFHFDDKGITSKVIFGRNIFIPWHEIRYIGVGELLCGHGEYKFIMYFSKAPFEKKYFGPLSIKKQNKNQFLIIYKDGMLGEILKHVDRNKIADVWRIEHNPNPEGVQDGMTSMHMKANPFKNYF